MFIQRLWAWLVWKEGGVFFLLSKNCHNLCNGFFWILFYLPKTTWASTKTHVLPRKWRVWTNLGIHQHLSQMISCECCGFPSSYVWLPQGVETKRLEKKSRGKSPLSAQLVFTKRCKTHECVPLCMKICVFPTFFYLCCFLGSLGWVDEELPHAELACLTERFDFLVGGCHPEETYGGWKKICTIL